jgi:hypothetical protein
MANIGTLTAYIGADTKMLSAGLVRAKGLLVSFGGAVTSLLGPVGVLAAGAGGFYGMAKGLGVIADATKVAARIQVLNRVMLMTGKNAAYSEVELMGYKQRIIELGIAEKEALEISLLFIQSRLKLADATKIARAAQDLAVISGQNSSDAARTLTQAIVAQRPILLKQFGIITSLDKIYNGMAQSLHKTRDALTETEKRQGFMNEILLQSATVAGAYEEAMEDVGKRMTSIPRYVQEARAAIGKHFLPIMELAVDSIANLLKWLKRLGESEGMARFGGAIELLVKAQLPALVSGFQHTAIIIYESMEAGISSVEALGTAVGALFALLTRKIDLKTFSIIVGTAMDEALSEIADVVVAHDAAIADMADHWTKYYEILNEVTSRIVSGVEYSEEKLAKAFDKPVPTFALPEPVSLEQKFGGILEVIEDFNEHQEKSAAMALATIRDQYDLHAEWLESWAGKVSGAMSAAFQDFFFDAITGRLKSLQDYLTSFLNSIARIVSQKLATSFVEKLIPGFQHGGIVRQPTLAMVGERGPEAVIPLDRLERAGGLPTREERPINVSVNVNTPDVGSFKSSHTQIATQIAAALAAARRNM